MGFLALCMPRIVLCTQSLNKAAEDELQLVLAHVARVARQLLGVLESLGNSFGCSEAMAI